MFKNLGRILYCSRSGSVAEDAIEEFMQIYVDQCSFFDHFRIWWLPKIGYFLSLSRVFFVVFRRSIFANVDRNLFSFFFSQNPG